MVYEFKDENNRDKIIKSWINELNESMKVGNYLKALHEIINIRNKSLEIYNENNLINILNGKILPELRNKEFPKMEYYEDNNNICKVDRTIINDFKAMNEIYKEMMLICEEECKRILQLDKIIFDLKLGIVYYLCLNENIESSMNWLKENNINDGIIYEYINVWKYGKENSLNLLKMINKLPSIEDERSENRLNNKNENIYRMIENNESMKMNEYKSDEIELNEINVFDENINDSVFESVLNCYK